ncbi:histidine phosphotransferase family protein [Lentibacter sp.]|uniref:histidine phosphotransferase family protein n=1 Tax=Lentibacter sp. TaxID=2024994 RepID=UPI003F69BE81
MAQDPLSLAKLIASRICHDLISPVGAIANGMELMALSGGDNTPELDLISDSVAGANARIKFYRVALGLSSSEQKLGRSEISKILDDYYKDTRFHCDWDTQDDCPRPEVQAAFLALLCLATALPTGGQLRVTKFEGVWTMSAEAAMIRTDDALWATLTSGIAPETLKPAEVQFAMLPECTSALARRPTYQVSDTAIQITF